ncbi:MAG: FAD-binding oxidoreductase [bacterium]|nr:FAD-binding oxidoreductase [bacterium]MDE0290429.1 FAD-binding oxidoreductase [bacterium]MDE0437808.1 FAD-binding oxidoreductase [bacterium]
MPSRVGKSVVIAGGGAVGLCCAMHLLRRGYEVTVVDPGEPGDGASGHNAGLFSVGNCLPTSTPGVIRSVPRMLVDPYSPLAIRWPYLPRMLPWLLRFIASGRPAQVERASVAIAGLVKQALRAWEDVLPSDDCGGVVIEGGHLLGYGTDAVFAKAAFAIETRRRRGIDMRVLDADGIAELSPILEGRFRHGVYIPRGPWADPRVLCAALTDLMVSEGGRRVAGKVTGFVRSGSRVVGAETTGGRMDADVVVIAAGAWSKSLTRMLGFTTPLDTERGYGVDLPDPGVELPFPIISMDYHFGMTPLPNGLRLAGTDELAGLEAPPDYRRADRLVDATKLVFPELRTHGAKRWMSYRPSHPDSLPVIGRAPRQRNVFLAYGHGHIGFTLAAITGEIIGQLVSNEDPSLDMAPFRPSRFRLLDRR